MMRSEMLKDNVKPFLPYVGLPVLCILLLVLQIGRLVVLEVLQGIVIVIFGYIAAVNDIKTKKIANKLVLAMLAGWGVILALQVFTQIDEAVRILVISALGFAVAGGLFLLVYVISRKGLGGGDVKFMAVAGLYLGVFGVIPAMLYGTVLAGLTGLVLILMKKITRKGTIPLAPFLYVGILITVFLR
jgi:Flp pilus assembly protein protease CpaA